MNITNRKIRFGVRVRKTNKSNHIRLKSSNEKSKNLSYSEPHMIDSKYNKQFISRMFAIRGISK